MTLYSRSYALSDIEQTQNTSVFLCHNSTNPPYTHQREHMKCNTKISVRMHKYILEMLTGVHITRNYSWLCQLRTNLCNCIGAVKTLIFIYCINEFSDIQCKSHLFLFVKGQMNVQWPLLVTLLWLTSYVCVLNRLKYTATVLWNSHAVIDRICRWRK
jgi:hypothetical protein